MKETTVQIDGMMSIFHDAGVEKQIKRRDGVVRVDANFLSGTATIVYDETRIAPDDIKRFIAECGYHCRGEVVPAHVCEPGKPVILSERPSALLAGPTSASRGHAMSMPALQPGPETAASGAHGHGSGDTPGLLRLVPTLEE
jgi:Cu2+-exporting ATPase